MKPWTGLKTNSNGNIYSDKEKGANRLEEKGELLNTEASKASVMALLIERDAQIPGRPKKLRECPSRMP